jgi:hypothetical protein
MHSRYFVTGARNRRLRTVSRTGAGSKVKSSLNLTRHVQSARYIVDFIVQKKIPCETNYDHEYEKHLVREEFLNQGSTKSSVQVGNTPWQIMLPARIQALTNLRVAIENSRLEESSRVQQEIFLWSARIQALTNIHVSIENSRVHESSYCQREFRRSDDLRLFRFGEDTHIR